MNKGEGSMKYQSRRSANMKERGPNHPWEKKAMSRALFLALGLLSVLGLLFLPSAEAASAASWQVGRGVIQKAPPVLKLSLRNDGSASKEGVLILGRWAQGSPGKRAFSSGELGSMFELGSFTGEVALKKTAIIEVPLSALGNPPAAGAVLEIAVVTGRQLTDGQAIQY